MRFNCFKHLRDHLSSKSAIVHYLLISMCLHITSLTAFSDTQLEPEKSLVRIVVTCQTYDPVFPWRRTAPFVKEGYAVFIGSGRLLTTETMIRNHVLVEFHDAKSAIKTPARVVAADYQINLAILDISDSDAEKSLVPVPIAKSFDKDMDLTVAQLDDSGQVQTGSGRITEISSRGIPRSDSSILIAQVLTDLMAQGEGGAPLFADDHLFGVVMHHERQERKCYVLPYPIINRFINDAAAPFYRGTAAAGFLWTNLVDPYKRAYFNLTEDDGGILVLRAMVAGNQDLQPEDVILKWNGKTIDNRGYYEDPVFGKLLVSHLVRQQEPDDIAEVDVMRQGRRIMVEVSLSRIKDTDSTIPYNTENEQAEYLVEGGFLFRELSLDYLEARGPQWSSHVDPRLVHLWLRRLQVGQTRENRVVLLSRVLPDPINIGYEAISDAVVTGINSEEIRNLEDVFRIADRDGGINRIALESFGVDIVLDTTMLPAANKRIAANYHIPVLRHQRSAQQQWPGHVL